MVSTLIFSPVISSADETKYDFDDQFPRDTLTREDWRSNNRGISQMDIGPLRPSAKRLIDEMEYSSDASAQAQYSGTGVTITKQADSGSLVKEGSFSLKAVIDGTNDRSFGRTVSINLDAFQKITLWTRCSTTSSAIQFYVSDGTNSSYWDLTTDSSADTWKQHTITLASPDSNSGTAADLSAVTSYGYRLLDASITYYFDTIKAVVGMTVAVRGANLGAYYQHAYLGIQPLVVDAQAAPTIAAPVSNPRIDILTINSSGTLAWVVGTENSTPAIPWSSLAANKIPICLVYCKTTMTSVLDYEDKDTDSNQGYIYADVRPFLNLSSGNLQKGADVASTASMTLGNDGNFFDITGTTTITSITAKPAGTVVWLQFDGALTVTDGSNLKLNGNFSTAAESVLQLVSDGSSWYEVSRQPTAGSFISLSDTPSSFSGQAKKYVRVNTGATALEFITDPFDTTSGHDHDGTDAKKVLATNLDPTGITDGHFLKRSGSGVVGEVIDYPNLGSWTTATFASGTQAASDGFFTCLDTSSSSSRVCYVECLTDSSSTPTTIRTVGTVYMNGSGTYGNMSCMSPVKSADYYKCNASCSSGSTGTQTKYFIPNQ